ncbi:hypothetical protein [Gloeobacter kilaueensis]|uniref:HPr kinase n=1 Tax=Gloeobacter kilaueensis (strain ATCC BAA-2537 / CCAP 1431/1 / ULC 316 / JS1) TaxID=1183438 RepID=U5QHK8_GLOK1|nr:hypothetical protein [Gloeobacter kilaueensis]AGY58406.1 HPr kinase [Gloeobacter kilaueensis JS1]
MTGATERGSAAGRVEDAAARLYSAYGLKIASNRPIPALAASVATGPADLTIELAARPEWLDREMATAPPPVYLSPYRDEGGRTALIVWERLDGHVHFAYSDGAEFLLDRTGSRLWAWWPATLTEADALTYLLGPVFGFLLRLRGTVALHASAVAIAGRAVVFVGPAEAGKSTLAAALARRGLAVLSDDIVPLVDGGTHFLVQPGYPRLRLRPTALTMLACAAGEALALPEAQGERRLHLDLQQNGYRFWAEPLPLGALYLLAERHPDATAPRITPAMGQQGLIALVGNTYAARLLNRAMREQEFDLLARLSEQMPPLWLHPHSDPARLDQLCDRILEATAALGECR